MVGGHVFIVTSAAGFAIFTSDLVARATLAHLARQALGTIGLNVGVYVTAPFAMFLVCNHRPIALFRT
jgi:hypothetical protein